MILNESPKMKLYFSHCSTLFIMVELVYFTFTFANNLEKKHPSNDGDNDVNPFNQHLPDCNSPYHVIRKITKSKAVLCPMIRDEEGFLSEWVAFYQMHGFDHIMVFNDNSTDNGLEELSPWIKSGFVSVRSNWDASKLNMNPHFSRNQFKKSMTTKSLLERECKNQAVAWGYHYFVSLDLDEYVVPLRAGVTIVDELDHWFNYTGRAIYCIPKLNFQQSPHTLEPVNLLTIEAYQTRMKTEGRMNYYMSVSPKCAYRLQGDDFSSNTTEFIATCCNFHGCQGHDIVADSKFCGKYFRQEMSVMRGRKKKGVWLDSFVINHYSRSLEKYAIKSRTWRTATGEVKKGETDIQAAKSYDVAKFFGRNVGMHTDRSALRFSCQLREMLANITGDRPYLRPGTLWYRNPEFGKPITDPDKRGRYGRPNPPGFRVADKNLYHYHGRDQLIITPPVEKKTT